MRGFVVAGIAMMLMVAACGSSEGSSPSTAQASGGGSSDLTLDKPAKFILLAETKGESGPSVPDFADAAAMAGKDINDAGGVGGQPLSVERIPTSGIDAQAARDSLLKAIDEDPTMMMGLVSGGTSVPNKDIVADSGIPMIYFYGDVGLNFGTDAGSDYDLGYSSRASTSVSDKPLFDYMVESLHPKTIALLCTDVPVGTQSCDVAQERADEAGIKVVAREKFPVTATDLTAQVQAIGTAKPDAVFADPFPNQFAVFMNQMVQNGFKIPTFTGASAQIVISQTKAVTGEAAKLVTGAESCVPALDKDPDVQAWVERYKASYGYTPGAFAAMTYDMVQMGAKAIEAAGSTDHDAVGQAMGTLSYKGICDSNYQSDQYHLLPHEITLVSFAADGSPSTIKTVTVPPAED